MKMEIGDFRLEKILMAVSLVGMGIFTLDIIGSIVYYILSWISLNIKKISIVQSRDDAMMLFLVGVFAVSSAVNLAGHGQMGRRRSRVEILQ